MKKRKLKKWVKVAIAIISLVAIVTINNKLDKDFIKDCTKTHSQEYCKMVLGRES